jgi:hypothetical protein
VILIVIAEILLSFFYQFLAGFVYKKTEFDLKSVLKGFLERIFLLIAFCENYPVALTFFGALKLGTRIKHNEQNAGETAKFNDYYLIGNLISVLAAFGYTYLWRHIQEIPLP